MDEKPRVSSELSHPPRGRQNKEEGTFRAARRVRHRIRSNRFLKIAITVTTVPLIIALGACSSADDTPDDGRTGDSGTDNILFAPYLYLGTERDTPLRDLVNESDQQNFVLAFVLAGPGRCTPSWNGVLAIDDIRISTEVARIRERGGDVIVATGGASGPYLENACDSADELAAAYGQALDAVGSNHLDVDIEADIPVDMVNDALAMVQQDRGTTLTYTLQVEDAEEGLTSAAVEVLHNAAEHDLDVIVNAMVMNFGYTGEWGSAMVSAAESTVRQMGEIWPDEDMETRRGRLGITTLIGRNDSGMVTTLDDARVLADYARSNDIAYVGFWSVSRDNGSCPGQEEISESCSGVIQEPYEFIELFQELVAR